MCSYCNATSGTHFEGLLLCLVNARGETECHSNDAVNRQFGLNYGSVCKEGVEAGDCGAGPCAGGVGDGGGSVGVGGCVECGGGGDGGCLYDWFRRRVSMVG